MEAREGADTTRGKDLQGDGDGDRHRQMEEIEIAAGRGREAGQDEGDEGDEGLFLGQSFKGRPARAQALQESRSPVGNL